MFDFHRFQKDCKTFSNQNDFSKYLESSFEELESYFAALEITQLNDMKFDLAGFLYGLMDNKLIMDDEELIIDDNPPRINALLLLLAEQFERAKLIGAITIIDDYLPKSAIKNSLKASILYLNVNDISRDYHERFPTILTLITKSDDAYEHKVVNSVLNYFLTAMEAFSELQNGDLANSFKKLFLEYQPTYRILKNELIKSVIDKVTTNNYTQVIKDVQQQLNHNTITDYDESCRLDKDLVAEKSDYSEKLYAINEPDFNKIKQTSNSIGRTLDLYGQLDRGIKIIDNEALLYQYIFSFSNMHEAKLYDAFKIILPKLNHTTINIIDWGCGQALATILLLEYIKEKELNIDIRNIALIEPSKLSLSRGLLHVDVLKQKEYNVKAINKDLDCLEPSDIKFNDDNIVLHLFSNILDVESFKLDKTFLKKISSNIQSKNYFVCVSPNINDKRNGRLDLFYKYFDENFDTDIISSRDMNIVDKNKIYKRYEKVFEVNYTKKEDIVKSRDEIKDYHVDIYTKLNNFKSIVSPIIEPVKFIKNIEEDPDYVIFKIRKVTEIITSKIYSEYKDDESRVSQNNKIRYLSFDVPEDKRLTRKAISHLHTIRTIGNISVHEHIDHPTQMLKDDAYFLTTALVLLIEDLIGEKIIIL